MVCVTTLNKILFHNRGLPLDRYCTLLQTGRSRGFCFVYFENQEDAKVAKNECTGMEIDGRRIRVDYSITQRAHTPTPGIYMGKPTWVSSSSIIIIFVIIIIVCWKVIFTWMSRIINRSLLLKIRNPLCRQPKYGIQHRNSHLNTNVMSDSYVLV